MLLQPLRLPLSASYLTFSYLTLPIQLDSVHYSKHSKSTTMYFRVLDDAGSPLEAGNNSTSETQVKNALIELITPDVCGADLQDYEDGTLRDLLRSRGWTLEKDVEPFPGEVYELEEINN